MVYLKCGRVLIRLFVGRILYEDSFYSASDFKREDVFNPTFDPPVFTSLPLLR